ncbi:hypothetical protein CHLRE_12g552400v5 [Chlamydomonas reinhardtii]|uniref:Nucleotide-diphospho-sugar transferase domain-containing protein n=1 Tax=Chlamydomonas reinhardtii TaxID=3055 RepID=A0A2K3D620_CHLRE|nr:uncharacterized protein CHLRE_12g552400v5 [Chlamydomonas reinhardtii]PNW75980.1 hypothetical protein CHLRE_12g552400v5 [Chlamydomonas reinhardtii]
MAFSTFVLFACGVAASSRATSVSTDTSILISSDSRHVPWLQPSSWQPAHSGVTELDALLKLRASPSRWVTVYLLALPTNATALDSAETRAFLRLALNTFLTYRVYGHADHDIVACMNAPALDWCRRYRLPCADASTYAADAANLKRIGWAKFKMMRDILKKGYHVHLSDLDVSYLKPLAPAVEEVFSWSNGAADGSMMQEEWVHQDDADNTATRRPIYLANTGVVWLRANERGVKLMESLLKWEGDSYQDQYIATHVAYESWAPCQEEATCLVVRGRGMAAITRHPAQFAHSNCEPEPHYAHCASRRLYVHAICRGQNTDKEAFLRSVKAMFILPPPVGARSGGGSGRLQDDVAVFGQQDMAVAAAGGLPCPAHQQRAWSVRFYPAYTASGADVGAGTAGASTADATGPGPTTTAAGGAGGAQTGSGSAAEMQTSQEAVAAHMSAESDKVRAQALQERTSSSKPGHSRKAHQRPHRHLMRLRS